MFTMWFASLFERFRIFLLLLFRNILITYGEKCKCGEEIFRFVSFFSNLVWQFYFSSVAKRWLLFLPGHLKRFMFDSIQLLSFYIFNSTAIFIFIFFLNSLWSALLQMIISMFHYQRRVLKAVQCCGMNSWGKFS
jgi:hypothetical protein